MLAAFELSLVFGFFILVASDSHPNYCLPIQPITQDFQGQPTAEGQQGRPGKIGPSGPRGAVGIKGEQGIPGQCACDPNEIERLQMEMRKMNDILSDLSRTASTLHHLTFCGAGIRDGRVPNSAMTSSSYHSEGYQAFYGRLDNTGDRGGFWHSRGPYIPGEWLQVDFQIPTRIVGVVTQGNRNLGQWVSSYKILYGNSTANLTSILDPELSTAKIFQGNRDRNSRVNNVFPRPITARYFRLVVETFQHVSAMRIEYLKC